MSRIYQGNNSERNSSGSVFTKKEVFSILNAYFVLDETRENLAQRYDVVPNTIKNIIMGRTYKEWFKEWNQS